MSDYPLPEHMKHLVNEISPKDLQRLIALEQEKEKLAPAGGDSAFSRSSAYDAEPEPLRAEDFDSQPESQAQDYIPWTEDIDLHKLNPVQEEEVEDADDKSLPLPSIDDIVTVSKVTALSVGMVLESSYKQLRAMKRVFNLQPPILRGIELVITGTIILSIAGFFTVRQVKAYVKSKQGPFLAAALVAPYNLEKVSVPADARDAATMLPTTIGSYERVQPSISRDLPSSPTNQCLSEIGYAKDSVNPPLCDRAYGANSVATGRYMSNGKTVDVVIARFQNPDIAERTMFDLLHHARDFGQVGNFSIGTRGSVGYTYSAVMGWYTFTWSHDSWIFSVSGRALSYVEDVVKSYQIPQSVPPATSGA